MTNSSMVGIIFCTAIHAVIKANTVASDMRRQKGSGMNDKINPLKGRHNDWPSKGQGYQPDGRNKLDPNNPPQGGSGEPKRQGQ